jgi:hypothetical protein
MGIAINSVEVGKCYVTAMGQVRRVLEINGGKVKYQVQQKTAEGSGSSASITTVGDGRFANDVEREVPCDYDPNSTPRWRG